MTSKCKFQGPAGSKFASFEDQALFSMNNYCPRWNDYSDPRSYIIPPVFYFKHPEIPDHELEAIKAMGNFDRDVITRTSDDAEHLIFEALSTLISDRLLAPFVAFHNLNVSRISPHLGRIFPGLPASLANNRFGEYDYVLIGPKIGIVVIEVKSTAFTGKRDFNKNLPEQYQHGIKYLRSFDDVVDLLEKVRVTSASIDRKCIRRILFTPNLKRARFDYWFASLDESHRNNVNECVEGIDR